MLGILVSQYKKWVQQENVRLRLGYFTMLGKVGSNERGDPTFNVKSTELNR